MFLGLAVTTYDPPLIPSYSDFANKEYNTTTSDEAQRLRDKLGLEAMAKGIKNKKEKG
jgi:hypothetical protein